MALDDEGVTRIREFLWSGDVYPVRSRSRPRVLLGRLTQEEVSGLGFLPRLADFLSKEVKQPTYTVNGIEKRVSDFVHFIRLAKAPLEHVCDGAGLNQLTTADKFLLEDLPEYLEQAEIIVRNEARSRRPDGENISYEAQSKHHEMARDIAIFRRAYEMALNGHTHNRGGEISI